MSTGGADGLLGLVEVCGSVLLLLLLVLPRFNRWPDSEADFMSGRPSDYVSVQRYLFFVFIYMCIYVVVALILFSFKPLQELVFPVIEAGPEVAAISAAITQVLGDGSYLYALLLVVALLAVPAINDIDQRLRSALLVMARVPREAQDIQVAIEVALADLKITEEVKRVAGRTCRIDFRRWHVNTGGESPEAVELVRGRLLRTLYFSSLIKQWVGSCSADRMTYKKAVGRLEEIAALLDDPGPLPRGVLDYSKEVIRWEESMAEIGSRALLRAFPDPGRRIVFLIENGIYVKLEDRSGGDVSKSIVSLILLVPFSVGSVTFVALWAFDMFHIRGVSNWLSNAWNWTLGASLSYYLAIGFGIYFRGVDRREAEGISYFTYILAISLTVICIASFFGIFQVHTKGSLVAGFFVLSLSLSSMAIVAIKATDYLPSDDGSALKTSLIISAAYACFAGVLQVLVAWTFIGFEELPSRKVALAFFLFGAVRGFFVALAVAYVLQHRTRLAVLRRTRDWFRIPCDYWVELVVGSNEGAGALMHDISPTGAKLRMPARVDYGSGDSVVLRHGDASLEGKILKSKGRVVNIGFDRRLSVEEIREFVGGRTVTRDCNHSIALGKFGAERVREMG